MKKPWSRYVSIDGNANRRTAITRLWQEYGKAQNHVLGYEKQQAEDPTMHPHARMLTFWRTWRDATWHALMMACASSKLGKPTWVRRLHK